MVAHAVNSCTIGNLTFVVLNRAPILGKLQTVDGVAQIIPTPLGIAISHDLSALNTFEYRLKVLYLPESDSR